MVAGGCNLQQGATLARVLLVMPPLPQRLGEPYLGQRYVASALLADGHQVQGADLAARQWSGGEDAAVALAKSYQPDLVGMTLFTHNALAGYRLLQRIGSHARYTVAGGPHATARPMEALAHGFDAVVTGEGEEAVVELARALDHGSPADLAHRPGLWRNGQQGTAAAPLANLDGLPLPLAADACWRPEWYGATGEISHSGTVTSRGCPARCTFCANHVTGRVFRWRAAADVIDELRRLRTERDVRHFAFWDDAFTANKPRTRELCAALSATPELADTTWSCITPANMVRPELLEVMAGAGCVAINFGIESGDPGVLKAIGKGQRPRHVHAAVAAANSLGMQTVVNFMFGFPDEGLSGLNNTSAFMDELASSVDFFNSRGVLVPLPATPVYEANHARYGFTDWWLREQVLTAEPLPDPMDAAANQAHAEMDPALEWDFFHYPADVRTAIADLVRRKARHNAATIARVQRGALESVARTASER